MKAETTCHKLSIFGDQYSIVSDEIHIKQSAELVDMIMNDIASKMPIADAKKVAVLAALRIASKLIHHETNIEQQKKKQEDLIAFVDNALSEFAGYQNI
jgi:cell division protein ZapA (FtsZ GTPase activity inhibitor)